MKTNCVTATSIFLESPDKYVISLKTFKSTLKLSIFMQTGQKKKNQQTSKKHVKKIIAKLIGTLNNSLEINLP